jgi:molybdopterin molybdotransferase
MRPFGDLTPYDEALQVALGLCEPISAHERLPLADCRGRVAAADVASDVDVPSSDRAAMDGFAVIASDLAGGGEVALQQAGRVLAGDLADTELCPGQCLEVATGARLPHGADAVVPVEHTRVAADTVVVLEGVAAGNHVSRRGEDLRRGEVVVAAGARISAPAAAALASIGCDAIDVRRAPRVLLVPTGDELVPVGEELRAGQVYDSNSVGVKMVLESNGAVVERTPIVRDDPAALVDGIKTGAYDLVVTLGGTSVGRHDLVLDVVSSLGEVLVHGIAIKPGKPVLIARVDATPVLGLPGFPTSCVFTAHTFAEPMVRRLAGLPPGHRRRVRATLREAVGSPAGKLQFLTVAVDGDAAVPVYRASSTITSMSRADGWIEIPAEVTALAAGTPVEVTFF